MAELLLGTHDGADWSCSQIVGRLATHISTLLQGKDKPIFTPKQ